MSLNFPISLVGKRASSGGDTPFATSLYDGGDNLLVSLEGDIPDNWNDNNTPYNATRLEIGSSCTSIGSYAFDYCNSLTGSLTIPDSVTTIGDSAFYYCVGLTGSLTIGNSVTSIGNYAFNGASLAGSLTIPNSVTSIGSSAFYLCNSITSVNILATTAPTIGSLAFFLMTSVSPAEIHVPVGATGYAASYDGLTVVYDL